METEPLTMGQAIDFIAECRLTGRRILGVERLYLDRGALVLDPSNIADFSSAFATDRRDFDYWSSAIDFISGISSEINYFLVVVE